MKKMLVFFFVSFACSSLLLTGCKDANQKKLAMIESKVLENGPALSQMEAIFSLYYTHYSPNKVLSDDFYIRRDQATAFYGYNLSKIKIEIRKENNIDTLFVEVPEVMLISKDRKISQLPEYAHENYTPKDANGRSINIDHIMDKKLDSLLKKYNSKSIEKTKELSEMYFKALAKRFGLALDMKYN
jgi:hypothetical protein